MPVQTPVTTDGLQYYSKKILFVSLLALKLMMARNIG